MKLTMDFLNLQFTEVYQLHQILNCTGKETAAESLQHIEYLSNLPMSAKEAKNIIPLVKESMAELSITYEDTDFYEPEEIVIYHQEKEQYDNILRELVRISNLDK
jgi:hypothetical protein